MNAPRLRPRAGGEQPVTPVLTRYLQLSMDAHIAGPTQPFGPGYDVLFDRVVAVGSWKEARVWFHLSADDAVAPCAPNPKVQLRFLNNFGGANSLDYESADLPLTVGSTYLDGYAIKPVIGNRLRLLAHSVGIPAGDYRLTVTCLLAR